MDFFILPHTTGSKQLAKTLNLRDNITVGYIPANEGEATQNAMTAHLIKSRLESAIDIAIEESLVTPFIVTLLKEKNLNRIHLITKNGSSPLESQLKEFIPNVELTNLESWGISYSAPITPSSSAPTTMGVSEIDNEISKIIFQKGEELKNVPINFERIRLLHAKQQKLEEMKTNLVGKPPQEVISTPLIDGEYHFVGSQIRR